MPSEFKSFRSQDGTVFTFTEGDGTNVTVQPPRGHGVVMPHAAFAEFAEHLAGRKAEAKAAEPPALRGRPDVAPPADPKRQ